MDEDALQSFKVMGPWALEQARLYLEQTRVPMRVAGLGARGYPLILSLWFVYEEGYLWCAVQRSSRIAKYLATDPRCAFEVAVNDPPYRGVRGQGDAVLVPEQGPAVLRMLIQRYLGDESSGLAHWLLSRADDEVAIRIEPLRFATWDYSERMSEFSV